MPRKIRRVVTGLNEKGASVVTFDGEARNVLLFPGWPGAGLTELWVTSEMPVENGGREDRGARPVKHDPDPGGTIFRIVEFPPDRDGGPPSDSVEKIFDALASAKKPSVKDRARHATMHETKSIDYLVVISGELTMIMDEGEVTLKPGDCIVQRGTRHGWANRGDVPVVLAAVLVDAKPNAASSDARTR